MFYHINRNETGTRQPNSYAGYVTEQNGRVHAFPLEAKEQGLQGSQDALHNITDGTWCVGKWSGECLALRTPIVHYLAYQPP